MKTLRDILEARPGTYRPGASTPRPIDIANAATEVDSVLDQKYGYGKMKGKISPIPGKNRQMGFGALANYNSAEAAIRSINNQETEKKSGSAVHRGWAKTVSQMPAPDPKKQANREKLKATAYHDLPKDEQEKDLVIVRAVKNDKKGKPGNA